MPRIPAQTIDSAPAETGAMLESLARRMGKLLNVHAGMAHSPVVLATYTAMNEAIAAHGTFDARTREAIALAVGAVDGCDYCQAAHTMSAKTAGFSEQQTVAIRRGEVDFDDQLAALVVVVREAAMHTGDVSDQAWECARQAGWIDEQLSEAFAHLAANLYTNYFNHYSRTELDVPPAPGLAGQ